MTAATSDATWAERAEMARSALLRRFGGRYLGLPFTHLARTVAPGGDVVPFRIGNAGEWHYWWQAHHLDATVDAALRRLRSGDRAGARRAARLAHQHLASIRLRNGLRFRNYFFDDMGWLALAVDRLAELDGELGRGLARASLRPARRSLARHLRGAPAESGGVFWNGDKDFTNAATTSPLALHWARRGDGDAARDLVGWVLRRLRDPETGLIGDGVRFREGAEELVPAAFTYNQGTTLAALLAVGNVHAATELLDAVDRHLTVGEDARVIRPHGGGDGGLFGGILGRYLALAARDPRLPRPVRDRAATLVLDTAEALWRGRRPDMVFSPDPLVAAAESQPTDRAVELSTQVQALMTLEAAAVLEADRRGRMAGLPRPESRPLCSP